jgi:hypothetical protein
MNRRLPGRASFARRGTAIVLALVFAVILLQFAIAYTNIVGQSRPQTGQIDERVRLHYLANGLTEIALLKYQRFPADFYNAWRRQASTSVNLQFWRDPAGPLADFSIQAPEFNQYRVNGFTESRSSFNASPIQVELLEMRLMTNNYWNVEALQIRARAQYTDRNNRAVNVETVRTVRTERVTRF